MILSVVGDVLCFSGFFNLHVSEFLSVKNFATLQALDIFSIFMPGDDSYFGMFTGGCHQYLGYSFRCSFRQIVAGFPTNLNGKLFLFEPYVKIFTAPCPKTPRPLEMPT